MSLKVFLENLKFLKFKHFEIFRSDHELYNELVRSIESYIITSFLEQI